MPQRYSPTCSIILALTFLAACDRPRDQVSESTRQDVRCSLGGSCSTTKSRVTAQDAPKAMGAEVRSLGTRLPLAITDKGYRDLLSRTRVVRKGAHAGSVGPVALSAGVSTMDNGLEVSVQIAPLPNLELFAQQLGSEVRLRISSVKNTQGKELIDPTNPLVSDLTFEALQLAHEPSMLASAPGDQQTTIDAVRVPGSDAVELYATRSVPLTQAIDASELGRVEGSVELALPVGATAFEQRGLKWSLAHGTVSIDGSLDPKARTVCLVVTKGMEYLVTYVAKNAAGEVLESSSVSQSLGEDGKAKSESSYDEDVASVSVVLAERVLRQKYPFVLGP